MSPELAGDVQGAVLAARKKCVQAEPKTIRNITVRLSIILLSYNATPKCLDFLEFLNLFLLSDSANIRYVIASPEVLAETGEKFRKTSLRMLTPEEIRCELEEEFSQLPPPVTVVFANKRCRACGQTGDPRLMKDMCHRNKVRGHTGTLEQRFSTPVVAGSLGLGAAGSVALGVVAGVTTAGSLVLLGLPFVLLPGLAVGGHRLLNTPSDQPALCCLKISDMR